MKRQVGRGICDVVLLCAMLMACGPRAEMTEAHAQAIRDSVIHLEAAMNHAVDSLDCGTGLSYVGDQPPVFVSGGRVIRTHAQLLRMCANMVAPRLGAVFVTDTVTAHAVSPDAAYVVREGEYTVNYRDGRVRVTHHVMTTIWQRQAGRWEMVHLHESSMPITDSAAAGGPAG